MVEYNKLIFSDLADLLSYPGDIDLLQNIEKVLRSTGCLNHPCHEDLIRFRDSIVELNGCGLEELYIGTFDVASETCPYVGFLVFGDSYKRGEFMVGLKSMYKEHGFEDISDLPDHISVLLRFITYAGTDSAEVIDLVGYAMHPALNKTIRAMENNPVYNPYTHLLKAVSALMHTIAQPVELVGEDTK